jgi:Periplasmic binding protein-like domain
VGQMSHLTPSIQIHRGSAIPENPTRGPLHGDKHHRWTQSGSCEPNSMAPPDFAPPLSSSNVARSSGALLVFTDISAIGALRALREFGKRLPEEVSVIGFDDM